MNILTHQPNPVFYLALLLWLATPIATAEPAMTYPKTKRIDHVDNYHGQQVPDPYRWLEQDVRHSDEVAEWVDVQNRLSFGYLAQIPQRESIKKRLTELWNYEKYEAPFKQGGRYYFFKNDGLQNQYVLYVQEDLKDTPRLLIDPNSWSKDGTVALTGVLGSDDGKYLAYGVAEAGSDWNTWYVMEIASKKVLSDKLEWVKFSQPEWNRDSKGLYYGRFEKPQDGTAYQGLNLNQQVYYHRIGTAQTEDRLIYQNPDQPEWGYALTTTEDGRYLIFSVWKGTDERYQIFYQDLTKNRSKPVELIDNFEQEYNFIGNDGTLFYFKTDYQAPNKRVIAIDIQKPQKDNWVEIVPERKEVMENINLIADILVAEYLKDASTRVRLYNLQGKSVGEVSFPGIGTATGFNGNRSDSETFYSFESFDSPPANYRYDVVSGKSQLLRQAKVDAKLDDYAVKQVFYQSKDGTRIPMFLAHKKGIKLDGSNPTLLYGYGGFNISMTPRFSIARLQWMEMGGVFAMANLRGGGEYGEDWHQAGTKSNKQNVFDDFIAAAEWLIREGYTSTPKLAIQGGSNGGLLVGAVMNQRPDLFGACLPAVGVMDMLRYHKFTAGRFWVDDYGSSDDAEEFKTLLAYSPYHNLRPGTNYPPTLITTADTDDRVVPGHSFKFAAALQHAQAGDGAILIRIETSAGHGAGKPTEKIIEEAADQWAFLVKNLGM